MLTFGRRPFSIFASQMGIETFGQTEQLIWEYYIIWIYNMLNVTL